LDSIRNQLGLYGIYKLGGLPCGLKNLMIQELFLLGPID